MILPTKRQALSKLVALVDGHQYDQSNCSNFMVDDHDLKFSFDRMACGDDLIDEPGHSAKMFLGGKCMQYYEDAKPVHSFGFS